jgi:hypothetical protein
MSGFDDTEYDLDPHFAQIKVDDFLVVLQSNAARHTAG